MSAEQEILNTPHLPEDCPSELAPELLDMMNRIPRGWGRWISCTKGWYPLITEVNAKLREIDPAYEIHQVKEKFGGLRYYFGLSELPALPCCSEFDKAHPMPQRRSWPSADQKADEYKAAWALWSDAETIHNNTDSHTSAYTAQEAIRDEHTVHFNLMQKIVDEAEKRSYTICEDCGEPGTLSTRNGWWRTVCSGYASENGYTVNESTDE